MFDCVAVVGATGAVGTIIRELLETRKFPHKTMKFIASGRSAGKKIPFAGREIVVEELKGSAFDGVDLVIASTPDDVARDFIPDAVRRGCVVIDESGYWRMDPNVPLVIPEVNPHAVRKHKGIISSPNCSTTQMVQALKPLHDAGRVKRVVVSTYQAVSGAGLVGTRDLLGGTKAELAGQSYHYENFAYPIAFNCIPQIGGPKYKGYTSEEMKMVYETRKMLEDDAMQICPTCIRVPVSNCHSENILVETERKISVDEARKLFAATPGLVVMDDLEKKIYPMPINCVGKNETFIGRIREDISCPNGLAFWCVSDNLRKGAATNAVQIAELLIQG
ncbi:MAG: aspartate-semialdehyde dehydrogenase [Planctomycetaceae bacterium]|nr:aspartate-semialdehyde dehydrogenase [Planctomycetaceae bacterium]